MIDNHELKKRDLYLKKIIAFRDTEPVKVVTGIRRCGKSSLLKLMVEHLKETGIADEQIVEMNFEWATQQFRVISIETVILAHQQRMQSAPAMASGVLTTSRECLAIRFIQGAWHGANDAQRKFPAKIMSIGL